MVLQEAAERKKEEEEEAAEKAAEAEDTWGKLGDAVSNLFGAGRHPILSHAIHFLS